MQEVKFSSVYGILFDSEEMILQFVPYSLDDEQLTFTIDDPDTIVLLKQMLDVLD